MKYTMQKIAVLVTALMTDIRTGRRHFASTVQLKCDGTRTENRFRLQGEKDEFV